MTGKEQHGFTSVEHLTISRRRCLSVVQVIVDYAAVVLCMTDSIDEQQTRRGVERKSPLRSARLISHDERRCRSPRDAGSSIETSTDAVRRRSSPASTLHWQHRHSAAEWCRNGRPSTRSAIIERTQDAAAAAAAADVRHSVTAGPRRRLDDDDVATATAAGFSATLISDVREVRQLMTALQSRMAAKDAVEEVARDWRLVASCLDRSLFCVYCAVVAVSLAAYFPRSEE